jgi:hypothetical protein
LVVLQSDNPIFRPFHGKSKRVERTGLADETLLHRLLQFRDQALGNLALAAAFYRAKKQTTITGR